MIAIYWGVGSWLILEVGGTFLVYTGKKQLHVKGGFRCWSWKNLRLSVFVP